jgi:exodeoxyribonuclease-3
MLIATWNINGVKARLANLVRWLKEATPDVCCLQEIKCEDEAFPGEPLEELGYNVAVHGQKGFNGVAILSKRPLEDVTRRLPGGGDSDQHSRYMEVVVPGDRGVVRVACLYLPNGNPIGTDKFAYKLDWMDRLTARASELLADEEAFILAGDFNVIPTPFDVKRPELWINDALFQPETRAHYRTLLNLGLTDAVRLLHPDDPSYTFWDYQAGAWQRNIGIRIDHQVMSPQAADRLGAIRIDKHVRGWDKPSDHVPVVAEVDI